MDEDTRLHNSKWLIPMNQSLHWTKDRFCSNYFELCNFKRVGCKQHILSTTLGSYRYRFVKSSVLAVYLYKITRMSMLSHWAISLGWEIIPYMRSKCFIQRCKTLILWNGSASSFPAQFLGCNSWGNLSLHLNYYICSVGDILCDKRILLERGLTYTLKSPNKQLMHTFRHFVVSLQSRFYTLALVFVFVLVFDMNVYSSSLRLFKTHPVVSLLLATNRQ
jgi:hypothetical protein